MHSKRSNWITSFMFGFMLCFFFQVFFNWPQPQQYFSRARNNKLDQIKISHHPDIFIYELLLPKNFSAFALPKAETSKQLTVMTKSHAGKWTFVELFLLLLLFVFVYCVENNTQRKQSIVNIFSWQQPQRQILTTKQKHKT